jgi:hypothetical protein
MAIDYSKLSDEELNAIANNDYSKLSDNTLHSIAGTTPPKSATDYVKELGQSAASLADTVYNTVPGLIGHVAYGARALTGQTPEQAQQTQQSINQYMADPFGKAFGIVNSPAYQNELSRKLVNSIGQGVQNVAEPIAKYTGAPQSDIENMLGTGMIAAGPAMSRAGGAVARGAYAAEPYVAGAIKAPIQAPLQFGKGFYEGLTNKEFNPQTSAMVPLRETYTPNAPAQRFMGNIPGVEPQTLEQLQSQARPTSEIVNGPIAKFAQAISPKTLEGETLVPLKGQAMQAFGERVGRGVRTNPGQALLEGIGTAVTGIPFKTLAQGAGELGARYLGAKTGFAPGFSQQLNQAQGRAGLQSQIPQTPLLTNNPTPTGPVAPPTMYVAPEGVAGTNINQVSQAGAMAKYPTMPTAQPQPTTVPPAQAAQIAAANRIINAPPVQAPPVQTPIVKAPPVQTPVQQPPSITQVASPVSGTPMTGMQRGQMIKDWVAGNRTGESSPLLTDKKAYQGSNLTRSQIQDLNKAGIDSVPIIEGATDKQVIDAMHGYISKNMPELFKIKKKK